MTGRVCRSIHHLGTWIRHHLGMQRRNQGRVCSFIHQTSFTKCSYLQWYEEVSASKLSGEMLTAWKVESIPLLVQLLSPKKHASWPMRCSIMYVFIQSSDEKWHSKQAWQCRNRSIMELVASGSQGAQITHGRSSGSYLNVQRDPPNWQNVTNSGLRTHLSPIEMTRL